MTMSRPRGLPSTAQSLMRWMSAWLALALLAQALAIGAAAAWRPHRHAASTEMSGWVLSWHHDGAAASASSAQQRAHALAHQTGERHQHALHDASVMPSAEDAPAMVPTAAGVPPVPAAFAALVPLPAGLQHVWSAGALWALKAHTVTPPRRPPRA